MPSLGSRPHDPLAAADGSIWWTGQWSNVLGRVDPKTGAMKEFPLKTPQSGPHGLVDDKAGNIWYTGISKNHIGKLDPKTGEVTEYPMPDPKARGPHTPIFDQKGILWFTLQSGMVGRLIPETGEVKVSSSPTANTYPYGIQVNSKGVPWYVDFRGNRVGSVDPVTMEIREYPLPDPAARPRRIALTPDDVVWYTDFARGYLGRFDPKTGQVKEWLSPGGPQVGAVRHRHGRRHRLVQRIGRQAEHARAIRHQDGEIPDLGDSVGRRRRPQHDGDGGWQPRAGVQRRQSRRAGRGEEEQRQITINQRRQTPWQMSHGVELLTEPRLESPPYPRDERAAKQRLTVRHACCSGSRLELIAVMFVLLLLTLATLPMWPYSINGRISRPQGAVSR